MTGPLVKALDHLVLTVADPEATAAFYARHLGVEIVRFGEGRLALAFGAQKINLHRAGDEFAPHAARPVAGSGDLCLLSDTPVAEIAERLRAGGAAIEEGPVARTGARRPLASIYLRDPDGNLIEIANEV
ncbi:MAG: VOC family protein [Paracoccaceae bacterium]